MALAPISCRMLGRHFSMPDTRVIMPRRTRRPGIVALHSATWPTPCPRLLTMCVNGECTRKADIAWKAATTIAAASVTTAATRTTGGHSTRRLKGQHHDVHLGSPEALAIMNHSWSKTFMAVTLQSFPHIDVELSAELRNATAAWRRGLWVGHFCDTATPTSQYKVCTDDHAELHMATSGICHLRMTRTSHVGPSQSLPTCSSREWSVPIWLSCLQLLHFKFIKRMAIPWSNAYYSSKSDHTN
jgi:hypothetical protein